MNEQHFRAIAQKELTFFCSRSHDSPPTAVLEGPNGQQVSVVGEETADSESWGRRWQFKLPKLQEGVHTLTCGDTFKYTIEVLPEEG